MKSAKDTNAPTNADHIRDMTDEELARNNVRVTYMCEVDYDYEEELYERWIGVYETSDGMQFDFYESAIEHEIDWLQQPAETEGTE